MGTKPQDIVHVLKLICLGKKTWTYAGIAEELCLSASETNAAARRAIAAGLCRIDLEDFRRLLGDSEFIDSLYGIAPGGVQAHGRISVLKERLETLAGP